MTFILTNGELELKTATIYSVINRFINDDLVKHSRDYEVKKYYQITKDGKAFLESEYKRVKLIKESINMILHKDVQQCKQLNKH